MLFAAPATRRSSTASRARRSETSASSGPGPHTTCSSVRVGGVVAAAWFLADAAAEGRKVVLAMLVVGLVFVSVIALGELTHHLGSKRKAQRPRRTL